MASATAFTAERMLGIEQSSVVSGLVNPSGHLLLSTRGGDNIDAGSVIGPIGPMGPGFNYRGAWAATTAYAVRDVVTANGSTFVVNTAHTSGSTAPTAAAPGPNLSVWAQRGTDGANGTNGTNGTNGLDGSAATPAGTIALWASDTPPSNWLICDGSAVSRSTYASLFAAIGTSYGAGNGTTTFNLPNLKGRTPIGKDAAQTEFAALAQNGGEKTHLLTAAEMPSHSHGFGTGVNATVLWSGATSYFWNAPTGPSRADAIGATANTGGGTAHNNLQPYTVMNFIIKYTNGDTPGDSALTTRVSALESRTTYSTKVVDKMRRLEHVLTGGGVRKVSTLGVYWSERFIVLGAGKDSLVPGGYWDITVPPNGSVIPVYNNVSITSVTVGATGWVPLTDWGALYYELPIGTSSPITDNTKFRIVSFAAASSDFTVPDNWILICARNTDQYSAALTWGDGRSQDFWKSISLANSWINYSGNDATITTNYGTCAYRWGDDGKIVMRGLIANGTLGTLVCSIPLTSPTVGPDQRAIFNQQSNGGVARVDVTYLGELFVMSYAAGGSNAYVSLEGIEWYPRQ